jgi:NADH dehydrogenase [ubiquinone] 1 alpha subcomplex assembly factor 7
MFETVLCKNVIVKASKYFRERTLRLATCIFNSRHVTTSSKCVETDLTRQLKARIRFKGPITVAEYMKEVLTNSAAGYYMHRDVFGSKGDFITSPEISQMFGELIGIWCVNEWMQSGSPDQLQVIELGPGRGTLADDMLRVFTQFPGMRDAVSLHLVEISPHLTNMQYSKLTGHEQLRTNATTNEYIDSLSRPSYQSCVSRHGIKVNWYRQLADVPHAPSFYIAHEFFDALPVHKFQKKENRWHEILVDVDDDPDSSNHLRFVLAPTNTVASQLLLQVDPGDQRDHIEVCPEAGIVMRELADRISADNGCALIADYGHCGDKTDTFRAFRQHRLFDPLCEPGTADLTADVDFNYLKRNIGDKVMSFGPVTQETFLHNMGIGVRLEVLLSKANEEQRRSLTSGYDMLTNHEKMGERFKFLALLSHRQDPTYVPAGFVKAI